MFNVNTTREWTHETSPEEGVCKIINAQFSWILEVQDQKISFKGHHNAEYFADHYESLGYKVKFFKENCEGIREEIAAI